MEGIVLSKFDVQAEVRGDLIFITEPATQFYAVYSKPDGQPQLILKRRASTNDRVLLDRAWQAANAKAREMGWIV
jgi:hypothetical protein